MNETLFEKYVHEELSGEEAAALAGLLRQDDAARRRFVELAKEWRLFADVSRQLLTAARLGQEATPAARRAVRPAVRAPRAARPRRFGTGIPARPAARPRAWTITALAAAVLIGLGLLFRGRLDTVRLGRPPAVVAELREVAGEVYVRRAETERAVQTGYRLRAGETVRTGATAARADALFPDGTRLALAADTRVSVAAGEPEAGRATREVELAQGRMAADVAHAGVGLFTFTTPHARVHVTGTRFVLRTDRQSTRVDLEAGRLRVVCRGTGQTAHLTAGRYAVLGADAIVEIGPPGAGPAPAGALLARYVFREGRGTVVRDEAGAGDPLDLRIADPRAVRWLRGGGLRVTAPTVISSVRPAAKVVNACRASGEVSLELWVRPDAMASAGMWQRIASLMAPGTERSDLHLMTYRARQGAPRVYHGKVRTQEGVENGHPPLAGGGRIRPELTHIVLTQTAAGRADLYVNGRRETSYPGTGRSDFADWESGSVLYLANGPQGQAAWLGEYHYLAIYSRALDAAEVRERYQAGIPQPTVTARR
ncbi:MAG: FecR domain-containing protein [Kiritimatiellae bacterium]|nr:FecR domain-containing protein [Kiritimatiellia bacterium]